MALKDWTTASQALNRVLAISPAYPPAYASLAIVRQYQGQKSAARVARAKTKVFASN
jgi:Tfp pilus assembly protein PilF